MKWAKGSGWWTCRATGMPASKPLREEWGRLVSAYLQDRDTLAAVVVVMDARHPLTELDMKLLGWLKNSRVLALLSKADKLSRAEQAVTLKKVSLQLDSRVLLFSSTTRQGVEECREVLAGWLQTKAGRHSVEPGDPLE